MHQNQDAPSRAPDALLMVGPGCPHCATMRTALETLLGEGQLTRLEVVDAATSPELAQELGVRTVPWARIGVFELAGLHTLEELRHWAGLAGQDEGMTIYLADLLASGRRTQAGALVRRDATLMARLAALIGNPNTGLSVRIGVMATLEELREEGLLEGQASYFAPLVAHPEARVRADACEALILTGGPEATRALRHCAGDPDPVVREIATDGLAELDPAP